MMWAKCLIVRDFTSRARGSGENMFDEKPRKIYFGNTL